MIKGSFIELIPINIKEKDSIIKTNVKNLEGYWVEEPIENEAFFLSKFDSMMIPKSWTSKVIMYDKDNSTLDTEKITYLILNKNTTE
jgi:hypothetical protein